MQSFLSLEKRQSHRPLLPELDSLGVVLLNPSTTAGVLEIVDGCQGFMLVVHNVRQSVLCHGDGVSLKHMAHCFHARCNGATPVLHLERLMDALVEIQEEIILQQENRQIIITFKHLHTCTQSHSPQGTDKENTRDRGPCKCSYF